MKIEEVVERECCNFGTDFKPYKGCLGKLQKPLGKVVFCKHCGQLWYWTRKPGEMDAGWEKVVIKDYED